MIPHRRYEQPTCSLRPVISNNACPPRITAAAGTEFAGTRPPKSVIISHWREGFTTKRVFFPQAMWLDQASAHCPRFLTAATPKCLGRVSVPVWLIIFSDQLRILGLVEHLPHQLPNPTRAHLRAVLCLSKQFLFLFGREELLTIRNSERTFP